MQLFVLGMHRSGTSVLARLLNLMGAYFAPEGMSTGANPENPKGFWERRDVRALNDLVLNGVGCDWNRVTGFDLSLIPEPLLAEFDKRASQIVLSMDGYRPWFLKEPRLCLLLPLWLRVLEVPVCIHILRHPVEVAASLHTRNQIPLEVGLALWEYYNRRAVSAMKGLPRLVVQHRDLMLDPVAAMSSVHAELTSIGVGGLMLPSRREVESFVSADLYREREGGCGLAQYSDVSQIRLFEQWSSGKDIPASATVSSKEMRTLATYETSMPDNPSGAIQKKPPEGKALEERLVHEVARISKALEAAVEVAHKSELQFSNKARFKEATGEIAELKKKLTNAQALAEVERKSAMNNDQEAKQEIERLKFDSGNAQALRGALAKAQNELLFLRREGESLARELEEKVKDSERLAHLYRDAEVVAAECRRTLGETKARLAARETRASISEVEDKAAVYALRSELKLVKRANSICIEDILSLESKLRDVRFSLSWRLTSVLRFLRMGAKEMRRREADGWFSRLSLIRLSKWFDAKWYVDTYPDVEKSGLPPELHFLAAADGGARNPSQSFDAVHYLRRYPDVSASGLNPLVHFITHGEKEGRSPNPGVGSQGAHPGFSEGGQTPL